MNMNAGLCETCEHRRIVKSARGRAYLLCSAANRIPTLKKYPPLPVITCEYHLPENTPSE